MGNDCDVFFNLILFQVSDHFQSVNQAIFQLYLSVILCQLCQYVINPIQINILYIFQKENMKIIVKTLKGQMIDIEVELTTTILQIKEKLKQLKGFEVDSQKIVLKGKATQNQDTVQKLNIKDKDFLVVMATIKKPQSKKQQAPKVEQKKQQKPQSNQEVKNQQKPQTKAQKKEEDPAFQNKINQLMSMGFPRQKCVQALRAAFGDSERAVEYVLNGIPAGLTGVQGQGQAQGAVSNNDLGAMLGGTQFQQLRQILRNNPTAIQPILQQLAQTSPQVYNLISQHPQQFQRMIMQGAQGGQGGQGEYDEVQDSMQPQGQEIVVTEAQQQAIQRLAALGFSKVQAAQAYLACDKNQQMAANLLFDRLANGDIEQGAFEADFQDDEGDDDNLFN